MDKKALAIKAVKDHFSMERIIESYGSAVEETQARMESCKSPALRLAKPSNGGACTVEDRIVDSIDILGLIEDRYRRALEFLSWFRPAWDALPEEEHLQ